MELGRGGEFYPRTVLNHPNAYTLKVKNYGHGRSECVMRLTDVQRVLDLQASHVRPVGRRVAPVNPDSDNKERSENRAKQGVRSWCLRARVDHMVTFTTRATISLSALMVRFQRFARAYKRETGKDWDYLAVPETHSDGVHFHLHVACRGRFDLAIGNGIWWALCATDSRDKVNGNIDTKRFRAKRPGDDVPSIVAGYIAKYLGKSMSAEFNRKRYWSSRIGAAEVNQVLLRAKSLPEAMEEVRKIFGFEWRQIVMTAYGCFFALPDGSGCWFKFTPEINREEPPF